MSTMAFTATTETETTRLIRTVMMLPAYNETLTSVTLNSLPSIDSLQAVLLALATPFFSAASDSLYRPPLISLTVQATPLTDRAVHLLCDLILSHNIETLALRGVALNDRQLIDIAKALQASHFNSLVSLALSHNQFTRTGLEFLLQALIETHNNNDTDDALGHNQPVYHNNHTSNSSLGSLTSVSGHAGSVTVSINSGVLPPLTGSKMEVNKPTVKNTLRVLDLGTNKKFGGECITLLRQLLVQFKQIGELHMGSINLNSESLAELMDMILLMPSISVIDLTNNGIYGKGVEMVATLVARNTLVSLDLAENKLGLAGVQSLTSAIVDKDITQLHTLSLRRTSLAFPECMVVRNIIFRSPSITTLDLSSNNINSEALAVLGDALAHNRVLTDLDLSFNILGTPGCETLATAIRTSYSLCVLRLHSVSMDKDGAAFIADAVGANKTLSQIWLSNNTIGNSGASSFARAIRSTTLGYLDLSFNKIGDKGGYDLLKSQFESNNTQLQMDLGGNPMKLKSSKNDCILM
eukprot:gene17118-20390_t